MDTKVFKRSEILGKLSRKGFAVTDGMLFCISEMIQEAGGTFIDDSEIAVADDTDAKVLPFDTIGNANICNFPVYTESATGVAFIPSVYFNSLTHTESSRSVNTLIKAITNATSPLPIYWEDNDVLLGIGAIKNLDVRMADNGRRVIIDGHVKLNNNHIVQRLLADKRIEQYSNLFGIEPSLMSVLMVNEDLSSNVVINGIIVKTKVIHDYFLSDANVSRKKPLINYQVGVFTKNPFDVEWNKVESLIDEVISLKQDHYSVNKNVDISIRNNLNYGNAIPSVGGYLCLLEYLGPVKPKFTIKSKYIFVSME